MVECKIKKLIEIFGDSGHFASLWDFYYKYIPNDEDLLDFFYSNLKNHPTYKESICNTFSDNPKVLVNKLPIFNCVKRFIEKAEIIHNTCRSDEAFVVILWVSMIEYFQDCMVDCDSKRKTWKNSVGEKRNKIRAYFDSATESVKDKILNGVSFHGRYCPMNKNKKKFTVNDFADWIYDIRNHAVHSGSYCEPIFNSDTRERFLMVFGKTNPNGDCDNLDKKTDCCLVQIDGEKKCTWRDKHISTMLSYYDVRDILVEVAIENLDR